MVSPLHLEPATACPTLLINSKINLLFLKVYILILLYINNILNVQTVHTNQVRNTYSRGSPKEELYCLNQTCRTVIGWHHLNRFLQLRWAVFTTDS